MIAGSARRPALAMRLWLAQRFGRTGKTLSSASAPGVAAGKGARIELLEHLVRSRARMFLRHTWFVTILGTVILAGAVWLVFHFIREGVVMKVAAGPAGGVDAGIVEFLAKKFAHDGGRIKLQLVATSGPAQSAHAIADRQADLAIVPGDIGAAADWPVVAILRQNVMAFIVPAPAAATPSTAASGTAAPGAQAEDDSKDTKNTKNKKTKKGAKAGKSKTGTEEAKTANSAKSDEAEDSGKLTKVSQLAGRRVGIVTGNEANANLVNLVLKHYGVPLDKVQVSEVDPRDLANVVRNNQVDALFVAGPATGRAVGNAVAAATRNGAAPSFIEIDQADGIAKRDPAFDSTNIETGTFGGNPPAPDDNLKTLSFPEYLVARKGLSNDHIAALARLIYAARLSLATAMPGEVKIEAPSTEKDSAVIVHPGALAYLNDDQKSFFDKYGDDIFYGLLIFPIVGSAIVAVAGYFRNSGRTRRLRLLQRLIDLVRKAHAAPSPEALDQLQRDVDNLVIAVIHQSEQDDYDETAQMSFSLALDQVRFAIAARRAALLENVGSDSKAGAKAAAA